MNIQHAVLGDTDDTFANEIPAKPLAQVVHVLLRHAVPRAVALFAAHRVDFHQRFCDLEAAGRHLAPYLVLAQGFDQVVVGTFFTEIGGSGPRGGRGRRGRPPKRAG